MPNQYAFNHANSPLPIYQTLYSEPQASSSNTFADKMGIIRNGPPALRLLEANLVFLIEPSNVFYVQSTHLPPE